MDTDRTQTSRSAPAPRADVPYPHKEVTEKVIGAAFEVHRELGPGFLEKVYEIALLRELGHRGVRAASQAEIEVQYKGQSVGVYYADILVDDTVICEIKAVDAISPAHEAQLLHYLKATGIKVGLLLNFGSRRLQVKRMVF
jgi:GxxExxY protein